MNHARTALFALVAATAVACTAETPDNGAAAGSGGSGGTTSGTGGGGPSAGGGAGGSTTPPAAGTTGTGGAAGQLGATGGTSAGAAHMGGAGAGLGGSGATGGSAAAGAASDSGGMPTTGGGGSGAGAGGFSGSAAAGAPSCEPPAGPPTEQLITFNDNGGWCWYQDERAVVDTKNNRLVIGSMASGGSRNGNVEAVVYDLATSMGKNTVLNKLSVDDHNAPGFVLTGSGSVAAMWATHRENCNSYFATLDGATWSATKTYDWKGDGCPWAGASTNMVTYANPWLMAAEDNRLYSGVRSVDTSPSFLTSTDDGKSWSYYGRLTASPQKGYVAGYYKYWGNGTDRIDWVGTEAHPRDADNSLWHGYVQGGKVYDSFGKEVDATLSDKTAQDVDKYTAVFKTGTTIGGVKLEHMWNHDIVRYADGTIAVLGQGRVSGTGSDDPDKRHIYARFDGKAWTTTYLVKSGSKLYSSEQDYTGLSALNPDNPNVIYVSTPYDPRDDKTMSTNKKREIWQGTTCDNGKTFTWTPVTQSSTVDNIRPIVPKWDASHTALLWMQGTYSSAQSYSMKIVGLIMGTP